jgi:pyruvyltransferase
MIQKGLNNIGVLLDSNKCVLKWSSGSYTTKNIGDVLNKYLFREIFKKEPVNIKKVLNIGIPPVYSFIGSVLDNSAVRNLTVMGSGFKSETSPIPVLPRKVIACRGPLTRKKLLDKGMSSVPESYGDPAILLPDFYNPEVSKKYKMGFIPHYTDKDLPIVRNWMDKSGVKYIDVFSDMETFVKDIKSCDFTISSSLHGVIISHTYGIPSGWVSLSDNLVGGDFKFNDYFQSIGKSYNPLKLESYSNIDEIGKGTILPEMSSMKKDLMECFKSVIIK